MSATVIGNSKFYWKLDGNEADDMAPRMPKPSKQEIHDKSIEMTERYRATIMALARAAAQLTRQRDALGLVWLEHHTQMVFEVAVDEFEKK